MGKADITPQTGYYLGGWTRADRVAKGQHTRLFSRAMVLERGGRKFALVQVDLFMIPGGMVKQIGEILASRGFSERNILISASHTHSGPGRVRQLPHAEHGGPEPADRDRPHQLRPLLVARERRTRCCTRS